MDADDIAYPQKFEFQYKYLETHPDIWGIGYEFYFLESADETTFILII